MCFCAVKEMHSVRPLLGHTVCVAPLAAAVGTVEASAR